MAMREINRIAINPITIIPKTLPFLNYHNAIEQQITPGVYQDGRPSDGFSPGKAGTRQIA